MHPPGDLRTDGFGCRRWGDLALIDCSLDFSGNVLGAEHGLQGASAICSDTNDVGCFVTPLRKVRV